MKRKMVWFIVLLLPMAVFVARAQAGLGAMNQAEDAEDKKPADHVAGYQAAVGVGVLYGIADNALDYADHPKEDGTIGVVSLGNASNPAIQQDPRQCEGYLILEWVDVGFYNGPGKDIRIHEAGTSVSGVNEATRVYISVDDEEWIYIGRTDVVGDIEPNTDIIRMDIPDSAPAGAVYRYVALCDVPDGITSGSPVGGPDIDAVEVINWTREEEAPVPVMKSKGEGNRINGQKIPDGGTNDAKPGDEIEGASEAEIEWQETCKLGKATLLRTIRSLLAEGDDQEAAYYLYLLGITLDVCKAEQQTDSLSNRAVADFRLQKGGAEFEVVRDDLTLNIQTEVTFASTVGPSRFDVVHDPAKKETTIRSTKGRVIVTPDNPSLSPFDLDDGYTVVVSADKVGEPFADAQYFLPMVRGGRP